jgi:elongation factor Tu
MSNRLREMSAKIYLLHTDEGGRKTPIFTGYKPAIYFGKKQTDGIISFHHGDIPMLGGEYTVTIVLAHPEYVGDALKKDAVFDVREGSKVVARGTVLDVKS